MLLHKVPEFIVSMWRIPYKTLVNAQSNEMMLVSRYKLWLDFAITLFWIAKIC